MDIEKVGLVFRLGLLLLFFLFVITVTLTRRLLGLDREAALLGLVITHPLAASLDGLLSIVVLARIFALVFGFSLLLGIDLILAFLIINGEADLSVRIKIRPL